MKSSTKNRIYRNFLTGSSTIIGRYIYRVNAYTGEILRAKREDTAREWIDDNGTIRGFWEGTGEYI